MNTLKVRNLLKERYSFHFLDLVHTISRPVFGTPCSYSNTVMRAPLREKIQNAISRAINDSLGHQKYDYNNNCGDGAQIIAGRRRSRKKKHKKNGQKKRKNPSTDIKSRLSPSGNRKGGQQQDSIPLIEPGDAEVGDNTENKQDENMPFDFLKKKKKEPPQEVGSELQTTPNDVTEPVANDDRLKSNDVTPADDVSVKDGGDVNTPDGQTEIRTEVKEEEVKPANGTIEDAEMNKANGKGAVTFANDIKSAEDGTVDVQTSPPDGTPVTTKSEKSPLIGKDDVNPSKVKDGEGSKLNEHQPGFLCCAIF